MTTATKKQRIADLVAQAREYHRRHDVTARNQVEETIREIATRAAAAKAIASIYAVETTVCGKQIQHDNSGVGHNWRNIAREDIPADCVIEIEGEIIDGKVDSCEDFVSRGLHYRW